MKKLWRPYLATIEQIDDDRKGKVASHDMVQFGPFQDFNHFGPTAQHALAKNVLTKIPGQFLGYMEANRISPNKKEVPRQQYSDRTGFIGYFRGREFFTHRRFFNVTVISFSLSG